MYKRQDPVNGAIHRLALDTLSVTTLPLPDRGQQPFAIDYHAPDGSLYWTDVGARAIRTACLDGSNYRTLLTLSGGL